MKDRIWILSPFHQAVFAPDMPDDLSHRAILVLHRNHLKKGRHPHVIITSEFQSNRPTKSPKLGHFKEREP